MDKAICCQPERSVILGDEFRLADTRRAEDEDLSTIETLFRVVPGPRRQCARSAETMARHEQRALLFHASFDRCSDLRPNGIGRILKALVRVCAWSAEVDIPSDALALPLVS